MNKFLNSVISKAAQNLDEHDSCEFHRGEKLVAFNYENKRFGCERCVYEGTNNLHKFISWEARDIKDEFDIEYFNLLKHLGNVEELSPQNIISSIRGQISQFFFHIRSKLDVIEAEIFKKVKDSEGLRNLAQIIQELNEECDDQLKEMIDEEKKALDNKADRA